VRALDLPDCWIGAGFVRDAVWDSLHGDPPRAPRGDVDVVWFDSVNWGSAADREIENRLRVADAGFAWSVKNQARMHVRNGDAPYSCVDDAVRHWPETATAIAVRITGDDMLEIDAPWGLDDLFALRLVPTPGLALRKRHAFAQRMAEKRWLERYPRLLLRPD